VEQPVYVGREAIAEARAGRGFTGRAGGLWCAGSLAGLGRPCVALVGTRAASPLGRRLAAGFARELGAAGCTILSGLALGIDAAAHTGALEAGAPTIGVLGSGHLRFYPARNRALAGRMIEAGGAVLSPFDPENEARPGQFLARNGIVAALADAVVVVEAPARSGALNTAGWAAGRIPVLAVPGDVDRPQVQGCLALIRDGATLARGPQDVLEALGLGTLPMEAPAGTQARDPVAASLLAALDSGAARLDDLALAIGGNAATALSALAMLELEGVVERCGMDAFARVR